MTLHDTIKTLVKYILMTALVVLIGIKIHMSLAIGLVNEIERTFLFVGLIELKSILCPTALPILRPLPGLFPNLGIL